MKAVCVLLIFASLSGCTTQVESTRPRPQDTSDAVREMAVFVAGQCKQKTDQNGSDFKSCFKHELDTAVDEIRRYEKCLSASGCEPDAALFFPPAVGTDQR